MINYSKLYCIDIQYYMFVINIEIILRLGKIQGKIYNCADICAKYNLNKKKEAFSFCR